MRKAEGDLIKKKLDDIVNQITTNDKINEETDFPSLNPTTEPAAQTKKEDQQPLQSSEDQSDFPTLGGGAKTEEKTITTLAGLQLPELKAIEEPSKTV